MLCSPSMCRARNHVGSNADFMLARSPSCPGPPTRAGVGGAMVPTASGGGVVVPTADEVGICVSRFHSEKNS